MNWLFNDFAQNRPDSGHFYRILTRFWPQTRQNQVCGGFDLPILAVP